MQLVDRNGVFKNWNTLKHEYDLQNNLYFQWMQLISAIPSNWKNIKQNNDINTFTTTQHYSKPKSPYCSKSNFKGAILDTYNNNRA